jgi:hypothetical protein
MADVPEGVVPTHNRDLGGRTHHPCIPRRAAERNRSSKPESGDRG